MQEQGITEALTGDRHFEQAGFVALLRRAGSLSIPEDKQACPLLCT